MWVTGHSFTTTNVADELFICSESNSTPDEQCEPIGPTELVSTDDGYWVKSGVLGQDFNPGWLVLRKRVDEAVRHPHPGYVVEATGEHFDITRHAAKLAGLTTTTIFDDYWVRYPAANKYIASLVGDGRSVFGQSWEPVPFEDADTLVVRRVGLLELAALPDFSSSLGDWAAGNESCPLAGVEGYASQNRMWACHEFETALGAVNATHFAPLHRQMYSHYHRRALDRMTECHLLADARPEAVWEYGEYLQNPGSAQPDHLPEALECEVEAMAYEMVGLHYMQDAWSTGHMWNRWGTTTIPEIPVDPSLCEGQVCSATLAPERATIASLVAMHSGIVHGTKGVTHQLPGAWLFDALGTGVLDDALSGPDFQMALGLDRVLVNWRQPGGPAVPGVGDLFWGSSVIRGGLGAQPRASLLGGTGPGGANYQRQLERLTSCTSQSMRDVYVAGPRLHGEPSSATSTGGDADPTGDDCWGMYATNESMHGSLSAVNLYYLDRSLVPLPSPQDFLKDMARKQSLRVMASLLNEWVAPEALGYKAAGFTQVSEGFKEELIEQSRHSRNLASIHYETNKRADPNGTESARGFQGNDAITFLGLTAPEVEPYSDPSQPPVPYADPELSGPSQILRAGSGEPHEYAVSRMFWRSHVREVCRELRESHGSALITLRSRCIRGGVSGVDVEACTSCTDLAELVTPAGIEWSDDTIAEMNPSMCERLGEDSRFFERRFNRSRGSALPPYAIGPSMDVTHASARGWCTGMWTEEAIHYPEPWVAMTAVVVEGEPDRCDAGSGGLSGVAGVSYQDYSSFDARNSMYWTEPGTPPWVAAFQEHYESQAECHERECLSGDRDWWVERDFDDKRDCYHSSIWHQMLKVPRCGVLQKHRVEQGECKLPPVENMQSRWGAANWQFDTPESHFVDNLCFEQKQVEVSFECPGFQACGSGGYCRADNPETMWF